MIVAWRSPELGLDQPREAQISILGPRGFMRLAYIEWGPVRSGTHGRLRAWSDAKRPGFRPARTGACREGLPRGVPRSSGRGRSEWLKRTVDYDTTLYLSALTAVIARLGRTGGLGRYVFWRLHRHGNGCQVEFPVRKLVLNDFGGRVPAAALRRISNHAGQNPRVSGSPGARGPICATFLRLSVH